MDQENQTLQEQAHELLEIAGTGLGEALSKIGIKGGMLIQVAIPRDGEHSTVVSFGNAGGAAMEAMAMTQLSMLAQMEKQKLSELLRELADALETPGQLEISGAVELKDE